VPQGTPSEFDGPASGRLRPWTPAQRHMAADLLALGTQHGRLLTDGRVALPLPLAEVSARSGRGRNCGTVYAHVRALRPAVSANPGSSGFVLDLDALSRIAGDDVPLPSANRHRPHLSSSERAVHLTTGPAEQSPLSPTVPLGEVVALLKDIVALVSRLVSPEQGHVVVETLSEVEARLDKLGGAVVEPPHVSRTIREIADDVADGPRGPLREGGRSSKDPVQNLPPSLTVVREAPRSPRRGSPAAVAIGLDRSPSRTDKDLDAVLRPLAELAERASLVGLTDRDGLRQALAPYEDAQVRCAVRQTLALARAGKVTSPIGWLVAKARQADELFFPPLSSLSPVPPLPATTLEDEVPDPEAEAAVDALEAAPGGRGELARIDALIRKATPVSVVEKMFAEPPWLRCTRVLYWRAQHPRPSPPLPEKKGN